MKHMRILENRIFELAKAKNLALALVMVMAVSSGIRTTCAQATESVEPISSEIAEFSSQKPVLPKSPEMLRLRNAANVTYTSRGDAYDDFLRILWVPAGTKVTTLTLGKRAFFTASIFFKPPVTVDDFVNFVGNEYQARKDFVVMRCRPSAVQQQTVAPILATWPNVLPAIASDLGGVNRDCSSLTDPGERHLCSVAVQYVDSEYDVYATGLMQAMDLGSRLYDTPESRQSLIKDYGIYPAFTGLGFTVWGSSASGTTIPMLTAGVLRNSVVPEYLLKNATLEEANCRCEQVPESEQLHRERIDPAIVWSRGKLANDGACRIRKNLSRSEGQ